MALNRRERRQLSKAVDAVESLHPQVGETYVVKIQKGKSLMEALTRFWWLWILILVIAVAIYNSTPTPLS